jgi:hypothetical protein
VDSVVADWLRIGLSAAAVILLLKVTVGPGGLVRVPGLTPAVGAI